MTRIVHITPDFAVAPALDADDFARVCALGFRTVINNRPDAEEADQLASGTALERSRHAGLAYLHIPASQHDLFTDPVVGAMATALVATEGPVLAYCKSGVRAAIVWAAASARSRPVGEILGALSKAGFDLGFLRDELDSQADRMRWNGFGAPLAVAEPAAALSASCKVA